MYAAIGSNVLQGGLWMVEQVDWNQHKRRLLLYVVLAAIIGSGCLRLELLRHPHQRQMAGMVPQ